MNIGPNTVNCSINIDLKKSGSKRATLLILLF